MTILVIALVYFLPVLLAIERRHKNILAIAALNVLLGWTFLGWIAAFVWCLSANVKERRSLSKPSKIDPALQWDHSLIYENGQEVRRPGIDDKFLEKLNKLDLK